jgi:hypothetical protein
MSNSGAKRFNEGGKVGMARMIRKRSVYKKLVVKPKKTGHMEELGVDGG